MNLNKKDNNNSRHRLTTNLEDIGDQNRVKNDQDELFEMIKRLHKGRLKRKLDEDDKERVLIRVYLGGTQGKHELSFRDACAQLRLLERGVEIEFKTAKDVREHAAHQKRPYWPEVGYLIDWLEEADIPFLLSQNTYLGFEGLWNFEDCLRDLQRLADKPAAYPQGQEILCPVFQSDKFDYLHMLNDRTNPTLKLPLDIFKNKTKSNFSEFVQLNLITEKVRSFMSTYTDGNDFILKAPAVEHQIGFRNVTIHKVDDVIRVLFSTMNKSTAFQKVHLTVSQVFPYLMLQPKMKSKNESKIVCLGGKATFVSIASRTKGLTRSVSKKELFDFAEETIQVLKTRDPRFLCDGLVRVDIFRNSKGNLVVNEVESLDSNVSCSKNDKQIAVDSFMINYWKIKIRDCFRRLIKSRFT